MSLSSYSSYLKTALKRVSCRSPAYWAQCQTLVRIGHRQASLTLVRTLNTQSQQWEGQPTRTNTSSHRISSTTTTRGAACQCQVLDLSAVALRVAASHMVSQEPAGTAAIPRLVLEPGLPLWGVTKNRTVVNHMCSPGKALSTTSFKDQD